jgi:hypothetical protein
MVQLIPTGTNIHTQGTLSRRGWKLKSEMRKKEIEKESEEDGRNKGKR